MHVSDILMQSEGTRFSLEVFPPKISGAPTYSSIQKHLSAIFDTIEHLHKYDPAFVSVTYNPEGKTKATSIPLAAIIKQRYQIESVAHLTCLAMPKEELERTLDVLEYFGIENILALRGDKIAEYEPFSTPFHFASDLVSEIMSQDRNFCIGVAGYPEGHPECVNDSGERNLEQDMENFTFKVDQGASFSITQLFLDNTMYFDFLEQARRSGVDIPIIPGIMPITDYSNIRIIKKLIGASVPQGLAEKLKSNRDDPAELRAIGVDQAFKQCKGLMDRVPCVHFYTMDKWVATDQILEALR